ncbi:hypothetical protein HNR44_001325 [Geomicrobium halophilum]|uniref:Purine nucleoside phosphorylase n=1 Tax=Geomicrobium halophilum TaxID=549000 RepID=A0A841PQB4_9BACL|nr:peptidoglycan editing factor PgeF [Geomicrobium halophilum]MBB6449376.1 hypothetical protein [Geomicrobium halophilum]
MKKSEPFLLHRHRQWLELRHCPSDIEAGFTTRIGGDSHIPYEEANYGLHVGDHQEDVIANRERLAHNLGIPLSRTVFAEQVHGGNVRKVGGNDVSRGAYSLETTIPDADGLYTRTNNLWLMSLYADCVPLYFFDRNQTIVGIAHAGWKGTAANIGGEMIRLWLEKEHVPIDTIEVVIGPAIGLSAYEVDGQVISALSQVVPAIEQPPWRLQRNGRYHVDLKETNRLLLEKAGVHPSRIQKSSECTYTNETLFFSHRRAQGSRTGRMIAYIGLNARSDHKDHEHQGKR